MSSEQATLKSRTSTMTSAMVLKSSTKHSITSSTTSTSTTLLSRTPDQSKDSKINQDQCGKDTIGIEFKTKLFSVCGKKNTRRRVVGGQSVEVNEYPWMVGLLRSGSRHPSCGAALISSRWLVTAAHCVTDTWVLDIAVIGEHDVTTDTESLITIASVLKYYQH